MILAALLIALVAPAPEAERLLAALRQPTSVSAQFVQTKTMRAFVRPQQARGDVLMARPRRLRWRYATPYKMELLQDGDAVAMRYPDLQRTQRVNLADDPSMKSVFDTLLFFQDADAAAIDARFVVQVLDAGAGHLRLTPRSEGAEKLLAQVQVWIDPAVGAMRRVDLVEPDGDATRIEFTDVRVNVPAPEDAFRP